MSIRLWLSDIQYFSPDFTVACFMSVVQLTLQNVQHVLYEHALHYQLLLLQLNCFESTVTFSIKEK